MDSATGAAVEVAVVLPISGNGAMLDAARAWTLVEETINEGGGIDGRPLKVRTFDTPLSQPEDLSPVTEGFAAVANEGFQYIISLIAGETLEPMMATAMSHGILAMSLVAEEQVRNLPEYNGMLLRAVLPSDVVLQQQAKVLQQREERSLVLIGPRDEDGQVDVRHSALQRAFEQCVDCEVNSITYPLQADPYFYDWASLGDEVMAKEPSAVYLSGTNYQALIDSVYVLDSRGYEGMYYFAYGGYLSGVIPVFWDTAAPQFRTFELAIPETPVLEAFREAYWERYDLDFAPEPRLLAAADYLGLLSLAMTDEGSDNPVAVARAMKRLSSTAGETVGPLDYRRAASELQTTGHFDYVGLSGPLNFNSLGDVEQGAVVEYEVTAEGRLSVRQ